MWMPAQTTAPPLADRAQRGRHEVADRREDDRRVELLGAGRARRPPTRAELAREPLRVVVRRRVNANTAALVARDLRDDVRGRAEAVQPSRSASPAIRRAR